MKRYEIPIIKNGEVQAWKKATKKDIQERIYRWFLMIGMDEKKAKEQSKLYRKSL